MRNTTLKASLLVAVVLAAGCAQAPTTPQKRAPETPPPAAVADQKSALERAETSREPERSRLLLTAMQLEAKQQAHAQVLSLAAKVDTGALSAVQRYQFTTLVAGAQLAEGYPAATLETLAQPVGSLDVVDPNWELRRTELNAEALTRLGQYDRCQVMLLNLYKGARTAPQRQQLGKLLWTQVRQHPATTLDARLRTESDATLRGWLEFARLTRDDSGSIAAEAIHLQTWLLANPEHPASLNPPTEITAMMQLQAERPVRQVAVIVPLTGRNSSAGIAVREGVMAAWFSDPEAAELRFYDAASDMLATYQQALSQGADVVIGPLEKDDVLLLSQQPQLPVPVIALNSVEGLEGGTLPLYQAGLSVEGEARLAADKALAAGRRHALLVQSSTQWSERAATAFSERFQAGGGVILARTFMALEAEVSNQLQDALNIPLSYQRAAAMQQIFGHQLQFVPYRRQDVDTVFIAASPSEARVIKPALAFHYAERIPVYATSYVYEGTSNPAHNADLDGIEFAENPWSLGHYSSLRRAVEGYSTRGGPTSKHLYPLGVDAYNLATWLPLLRQLHYSQYQGATGTFHIDQSNMLVRDPAWATFRNGRVVPSGG